MPAESFQGAAATESPSGQAAPADARADHASGFAPAQNKPTDPTEPQPQGARPIGPGSRIAVVANPFSGAKSNRGIVERFSATLRNAGVAVELIWDRPEHSPALGSPEALGNLDAVVVAGGDGSIGGAVSRMAALLDDARSSIPVPPVGLLPLGNENLLARYAGVRGMGPEALAKSLLGSHGGRAIDLGRLTAASMGGAADAGDAPPRRWTCMVSAGLDADVVRRVERWRSVGAEPGRLKRVRRSSYAQHVVAALGRYRYPMTRLIADGRAVEGAHVFVFNLPEYGGGLPFAPGADPGDGWLDFVVLRRPGLGRALGYATSVVLGRHARRGDVEVGRARTVRLEPVDPTQPAPVQVDGDLAGVTPAQIGLEPGRLRLLNLTPPATPTPAPIASAGG
ncbi:MAG: diacylglycerol kinase family protein [Planctomycetota bacterium]